MLENYGAPRITFQHLENIKRIKVSRLPRVGPAISLRVNSGHAYMEVQKRSMAHRPGNSKSVVRDYIVQN
jgi:hypothetical protein